MLVKPLVRSIVRAIAGKPTASLGSGFSPTSLFADGSKGVVYDNNDLSSLFLDAAGTTPATVNGLVGLQLDKSANLALGAELVTNGGFDSDISGWTNSGTGTFVWSAGSGRFTRSASTDFASATISTVAGRWYEVRASATIISGTFGRVAAGPVNSITSASNSLVSAFSGQTRLMFLATGASSYVCLGADANATVVDFDNISVKELPGNHRYQTTTGSKPVLRGTPIGANLVTNGDFASGLTGWTNPDTAPGTTTASGGTVSMNNGTTGTARLRQAFSVTAGSYLVTFTVSGYSGTALSKLDLGNTSGGDTAYGSVIISANGTYTRYVDNVTTGTLGLAFIVSAGTATSMTLDDVVVRNVSAGQVTAPYGLQYDGVDDFMQTASVDFTATDKMFVCAGVRKLIDGSNGTIAELSIVSDSNNGSFFLRASGGGLANYQWNIRSATTNYSPVNNFAAPDTSVLTLEANLASPLTVTRRNAVQQTTLATPSGGGNFGNYPLYFGRRAGTSLPYNGLDFGMVICGKTLTSTQISQTERYIAQRTGVTI